MSKVLHIVSSLGVGGAETWLLEILRYIKNSDKKDFTIDILVTNGCKDVFDNEIEGLGIKIYYITFNKESLFKFTKEYRKLLRTNSYNVIHDHQDLISSFHFLLGIGLSPAIKIAHFHNPYYQVNTNYGISFRRQLQLTISRSILKVSTTHLLGTSKKLLEEYGIISTRYPRQIISALHCSFPIEKYNFPSASRNQDKKFTEILFVGRFDYSIEESHPQNHKNSTFALKVFSCLPKGRYRLKMVGANDYILEDFKNLVIELGVEEYVDLLGIRHDVPALMHESDLLLFPSRAEGLGMVAVEAQAANLRVLASETVPNECVVIQELITFKDLKDGHQSWANEIIKIIQESVKKVYINDKRWTSSLFNIKVSYEHLKQLYCKSNV